LKRSISKQFKLPPEDIASAPVLLFGSGRIRMREAVEQAAAQENDGAVKPATMIARENMAAQSTGIEDARGLHHHGSKFQANVRAYSIPCDVLIILICRVMRNCAG